MAQAKGDVKLLGRHMSPYVIRARMALRLKGVSYEYLEQDLLNKSELLIRSNPVNMKVPVLIHDGKPICESLLIVQYVDEAWAGGGEGTAAILPADPYERAIARFWAAYIDEKLMPAWLGFMKATTEEVRAEKVKEMAFVVECLEKAFAECSNGKAFFGGDSVGYLDFALGCVLSSFRAARKLFGLEIIDAAKTPLLAAWAERFRETEVAKELLPEPDKVVERIKELQTHWSGTAARCCQVNGS